MPPPLKVLVTAGVLLVAGVSVLRVSRRGRRQPTEKESKQEKEQVEKESSKNTCEKQNEEEKKEQQEEEESSLLKAVLGALGDSVKSGVSGAEEALKFLQSHEALFSQLWRPYSTSTGQRSGETASAFNDFYKWTMFVVIRAVEKYVQSPLRVTFTVNIREPRYAAQLVTDKALQEAVLEALQELTRRPFDREVFEKVANELQLPWSEEDLTSVCGTKDKPRMLAQRVSRKSDDCDPEGGVVIRMFIGPDNKSKGEDRLYVEATGPWHRVTWLESTLMQCVYQALFSRRMAQTGSSFPRELASACCRTVRSVQATNQHDLVSALFVGRRTMGMPLMLFQTVFCAERLKQCMGTSSVHAHFLLRRFPEASNLAVVGTHAHELSMVLMALFGEVDDACGCAASQGIGHALYYYLLQPSALSMLPDTLGTEAFLRVASVFPISTSTAQNATVLRDVIGLARQDSGELKDFLELLRKYNLKCQVMASEIEDAEDLVEAEQLGYNSIGAGGFYGDSKKAWKEGDNISMAVKATEVFVGERRTDFHPLKLGDAFQLDAQGNKVFSKLEIDGRLSKAAIQSQKERAVKLAAATPLTVDRAADLVQSILACSDFVPAQRNTENTALARQNSQQGM